jgi:hypothetical protein
MAACADKGAALCPLAACYPCYCGGLAAAEGQFAGDGDWLGIAKEECAPYIDSFDVRSTAVRVGISMLVVLINNVLSVLLQVGWGRADGEDAQPSWCRGRSRPPLSGAFLLVFSLVRG